jgi:hypothetical protein
MTDPSNKTLPSVPSSPAWTCPTCGRSFHRIKQPHVCDTTTVEDHLRDKDPAVVTLFHAFVQAVQDAGPSAFSPIVLSLSQHYNGGHILVDEATSETTRNSLERAVTILSMKSQGLTGETP